MDERLTQVQIGRRELFDRIWSKPMTVNAVELGTTASSLSTLAKRFKLPLPHAGHWMKKEVGKAPPTPEFPADPNLDNQLCPLATARIRSPVEKASLPVPSIPIEKHEKVAKTRTAIHRNQSANRLSIGGRGKFRLFVTPVAGERACAFLDRFVAAIDARG